MSAQLVVLRGPEAGRTIALGDAPLSMGRAEENALVVADARASRRHAEIRRQPDGSYLFVDLGSANGSLINGQPASQHLLQNGDLITIGEAQYRYERAQSFNQAQTLIEAPTARVPPPQAPPAAPQAFGLPPQAPPAQRAQAPLPPLPSGAAPPPAQPPAKRGGIPIALIVVGVVLLCTIVAGGIGAAVLVGRNLLGQNPAAATSQPNQPAATNAPNEPAPTNAAVVGPQPTAALPAGGAEWTVLVYLAGDNNLEVEGLIDFLEMAEVGSSDELNIIVQMDRISSGEFWDDTDYGDWTGALRFRVEQGMEPTVDAALEDLGEVNMGDPQVLTDFIAWGIEEFPARRYAVILWDHGASWPGIASDDTDDGDLITLPELSSALENARRRTGVERLDIIGFDACLMAQIDVFHAIEPYGLYTVASAELEPGAGWAWDGWLGRLADDPTKDGAEVSRDIVETFIEYYDQTSARDVTLSAFDLTRVGPMVTAIDDLAGAMIETMGESYTSIGQARSYVNIYSASDPTFGAIDLGDFAELLPERDAPSAVAEAANQLSAAIADARIANGALEYHAETSGITAYFPQSAGLYFPEYTLGSPLPRQTRWGDFLESFFDGNETLLQAPFIGDLRLDRNTASVGAPAILNGRLEGRDIAYVAAGFGIEEGNSVVLLSAEFVYPPGANSSGNEPPNWPNGQFELSMTIDGRSWYLSNSSGEEIPALVAPIRYGGNLYGVKGVYRAGASGEEIDGALIFEVNNGEGSLIHVWGFAPESTPENLQPYEIRTFAGDEFVAYGLRVGDGAGSPQGEFVEGETIRFDGNPLTVRRDAAPSGEYVAGFLVLDVASNYSYDYLPITVDNSGAGGGVNPGEPNIGQPGATGGYQIYADSGLGFSIEFPDEWEAFQTASGVAFYDEQVGQEVYVDLSVFNSGEPDPNTANNAILQQLSDYITENVGGEIVTAIEDFDFGFTTGLRLDYIYDYGDIPTYVIALAVTDEVSGRTYLLTFEAPDATFDDSAETFNVMLSSLTIG